MPLKTYFRSIFLLFIMISACTGKQQTQPGPEKILAGSPHFFLEKFEKAEEPDEKIKHLNNAISAIDDPKDTLLSWLLDKKIFYHNKLNEYDSSLIFTDSLIHIAEFQKDTSSLAKAYYRKSKVYYYLNEQEQVFRNAFESKRLYLAVEDSSGAGRRSLEMANAQTRMGDFTGTQESATEALTLLNRQTDSAYFNASFNAIGIAYRELGFYKDAAREYRNALEFSPGLKDSLINLNNLALVHQENREYETAIDIFSELLQKVDTTNHSSYARFKDNLAYTKWLQNESADVEEDLLEAMHLRRQKEDQFGLLASYSHLIDFYRSKDKNLSKKYSEELLKTARAIESTTSELKALEHLIALSSEERSSGYALDYISLNDSLNSANLKAENTFAKIRYDEERKEAEIGQLETQNRIQTMETQRLRTRSILIFLVAVIFIIALVFLIYFLRQRFKREKITEVYNTEKRISKVIHDELANDIYNLMSGLERIVPTETVDKLESIYLRTRDISRENSDIDTEENYVENLVATLVNITPESSKVIIRGENTVDWKKIGKEKKILIYRVLQELMINMKKHSAAGFVAIIFSERNKVLEISYSDNGKGVDWRAKGKGSGLQNVENRISSIKGRLTFESEEGKGFKVTLQIPV